MMNVAGGKTNRMVDIVDPCHETTIPVHSTMVVAHDVAWLG